MIQYAIARLQGRFRIIPRDVGADATPIRDRLVGQDYFEVHAVAEDFSKSSTSWCVFVRPAATSARPPDSLQALVQ
ncbi:MAG TPA: hypothetical protein VKY92_19265 [Verrucomicrobiae bacterium]|nr:hypothetical protein [Verrucomicrobiae bacterium]